MIGAFDSPNGQSGSVSRQRWAALVIALVVVGLGALIVWYLRSEDVWPELRHSEAEFHPPSGFTNLSVIEAGSQGCFISCDSPRIALVMKTSLPRDEACALLYNAAQAVGQNVGRTDPASTFIAKASYFMQGGLPSVGGKATITAAVVRGSDLPPASYLLANSNARPFAPEDTVVAVLFNSHD